MNKYFTILHPRVGRSGHLPCLTSGCRGVPLNLDICDARALLEYRMRDDPAAVIRASCRICGRTSTYDYHTIIRMTPPELRPVPIPSGCGWAVILLEFPTAPEMPQRAFAGERVFIDGLSDNESSWSGYLASESQLAPDLQIGEIIGGKNINSYNLCEGVVRNNRIAPLPLGSMRSGLDIACFFTPIKGHTSMLQCGNVKCANPSCAHYFGLTYSQFRAQIEAIARAECQHHDDRSGYLILKCEVCHTSRVVDNRTLDGLFKM